MSQRIAAYRSGVLHRGAACGSMWQHVAACRSVFKTISCDGLFIRSEADCQGNRSPASSDSVLQCGAVCHSVLQRVAACFIPHLAMV